MSLTEGQLSGVKIIVIGALDGRKTGMKFGRNLLQSIDGHITGQYAVEIVMELPAVYHLFMVEMRHHGHGMHSGISAASSRHLHLLAKECGQCRFEYFLNRYAIRLHLPSVIAAAIESQIDKISVYHYILKLAAKLRINIDDCRKNEGKE